jgi:hypothetical protein
MPDDVQSADPAVAPEAIRSMQAQVVHQLDAEAPSPAERRRSKFRYLRPFRYWHPFVLLAIFLGAVVVGGYYKSHASPVAEPSVFKNRPPVYINVYETNPQTRLDITVIWTSRSTSFLQVCRRRDLRTSM